MIMNRLIIIALSIIGFVSCKKGKEPINRGTPIGQGVEIYKAKLEWTPFDRTKRLKSVTRIGNVPLVPYDSILSYYNWKPVNAIAHYHAAFRLTKPVLNAKGNSPIFGQPISIYASAPDSGYCVTVDRTVIFGGIFGNTVTVYGNDIIFKNAPNLGDETILLAIRDSFYTVNGQVYQQTAPDPRHDSRLLERFRRDGKLKF